MKILKQLVTIAIYVTISYLVYESFVLFNNPVDPASTSSRVNLIYVNSARIQSEVVLIIVILLLPFLYIFVSRLFTLMLSKIFSGLILESYDYKIIAGIAGVFIILYLTINGAITQSHFSNDFKTIIEKINISITLVSITLSFCYHLVIGILFEKIFNRTNSKI